LLMADDDPDDCMIASLAVRESGSDAEFSSVMDGVELMDHLLRHSRSEEKRLPHLILLDLNMPKKDGRGALVEIKWVRLFCDTLKTA
jgi:CheY-like chemotaxis protein